jgi:hypothetical protein
LSGSALARNLTYAITLNPPFPRIANAHLSLQMGSQFVFADYTQKNIAIR